MSAAERYKLLKTAMDDLKVRNSKAGGDEGTVTENEAKELITSWHKAHPVVEEVRVVDGETTWDYFIDIGDKSETEKGKKKKNVVVDVDPIVGGNPEKLTPEDLKLHEKIGLEVKEKLEANTNTKSFAELYDQKKALAEKLEKEKQPLLNKGIKISITFDSIADFDKDFVIDTKIVIAPNDFRQDVEVTPGTLSKDEARALKAAVQKIVDDLLANRANMAEYKADNDQYLINKGLIGRPAEAVGLYTIIDHKNQTIPNATILQGLHLRLYKSDGEKIGGPELAEIDFLLHSGTAVHKIITAKSSRGQIGAGLSADKESLKKIYHSVQLPPEPRNLAILFKAGKTGKDRREFRDREQSGNTLDQIENNKLISQYEDVVRITAFFNDGDNDPHEMELSTFRNMYPEGNLEDVTGIGIIPRDESAGASDIHLNLSVSKTELLTLIKQGINRKLT